MIKYLIYSGLVLTPFAVWPGMDLRIPKEIAGLGIALAIGLYALYNGSLKKFKNYWLLLFVGYFLVCMCLAPNFRGFVLGFHHGKELTILGKRAMSGFWAFKPFLFTMVYLLMTVAIASISFRSKKEVETIAKIMAFCGFLMALYIFVQVMHLDQFFRMMTDAENPQVRWMTKPLIGGFIGQPTVVSPFIAMLIPLAIYLRRYFWSLCMVLAVCLTHSKVAIGAMIVSLVLYLLISKRISSKIIGVLLIVGLATGAGYLHKQNPDRNWIEWVHMHESSGRIETWVDIWEDFTSPIEGKRFCVTGFGPGAFAYTYSIRKDTQWWQAHCEPLEGMYNFGFVGIGILLMSIWWMIKNILPALLRRSELIWAFTSSLICIFICSLGSFPLQGIIAPTMWYTVVIIALLHNVTITGGKLCRGQRYQHY